ncbi:hypothetical protein M5K25_012793 [Dendrobium thyrsiflorum]|uniref:Uncharacterized protein n=1 Tax=Dendrobium thyrsiflorum TaxID=117978 RepID=A0ABD0V595_DENTH
MNDYSNGDDRKNIFTKDTKHDRNSKFDREKHNVRDKKKRRDDADEEISDTDGDKRCPEHKIDYSDERNFFLLGHLGQLRQTHTHIAYNYEDTRGTRRCFEDDHNYEGRQGEPVNLKYNFTKYLLKKICFFIFSVSVPLLKNSDTSPSYGIMFFVDMKRRNGSIQKLTQWVVSFDTMEMFTEDNVYLNIHNTRKYKGKKILDFEQNSKNYVIYASKQN